MIKYAKLCDGYHYLDEHKDVGSTIPYCIFYNEILLKDREGRFYPMPQRNTKVNCENL